MASLNGHTIAFLVAQEGVEEVELQKPWQAVEQAGAKPHLVAPQAGQVQSFNSLDRSGTYSVDASLDQAKAADYDALVLPGGVANLDKLRIDDRAIAFVKEFFAAGKPVGVICHGPWTLVEADVLRGRKLTSWPSLATDIRNAGGEWVDEAVVVDINLVSSRRPGDLGAFCTTIIETFAAHGQTVGQPPHGNMGARVEVGGRLVDDDLAGQPPQGGVTPAATHGEKMGARVEVGGRLVEDDVPGQPPQGGAAPGATHDDNMGARVEVGGGLIEEDVVGEPPQAGAQPGATPHDKMGARIEVG